MFLVRQPDDINNDLVKLLEDKKRIDDDYRSKQEFLDKRRRMLEAELLLAIEYKSLL